MNQCDGPMLHPVSFPITSANTNFLFFPFCHPKSHKFTTPPLLHHKVGRVIFSSLSLLSSMENPPQGYRKNVGICLMSKKIFAASRLDILDSWQMPQGGIEENEDLRSAAIRELREEMGVSSADIIAKVPYWLTFDFPDVREKLRHQWG
ncbi:Nudix hydrolase 26 [Abeliophyllum distichum]|uniref:Nudix hydrolase 26 n=1 Tax=Abeliophyllum distichum TaxID=126358 RepID=A0ABD1RUV6_9LAMI